MAEGARSREGRRCCAQPWKELGVAAPSAVTDRLLECCWTFDRFVVHEPAFADSLKGQIAFAVERGPAEISAHGPCAVFQQFFEFGDHCFRLFWRCFDGQLAKGVSISLELAVHFGRGDEGGQACRVMSADFMALITDSMAICGVL